MNIWLSLDKVENKNVDKLKDLLKSLTDLSGIDYPIYFKVIPTSTGTVVKFCCDELNIEKDVTNYSNWQAVDHKLNPHKCKEFAKIITVKGLIRKLVRIVIK